MIQVKNLIKKDTMINKIKLNYIYLFIRCFASSIKEIDIINYVGPHFSVTDYLFTLYQKDFLNVLKLVKSSLMFEYSYFIDLFSLDNLDNPQKLYDRFTLIYIIENINGISRIFFKIDLPKDEENESLSILYAASVWAEREIYDLFGILFKNHPDLRRILTDYGFSGFPFRKDFPLAGSMNFVIVKN